MRTVFTRECLRLFLSAMKQQEEEKVRTAGPREILPTDRCPAGIEHPDQDPGKDAIDSITAVGGNPTEIFRKQTKGTRT